MSRLITSLGLLLALLVLSAAGPCLACSFPSPDTAAPGSCCHHGGCEKPAKTPAPQRCAATPDFGNATIEKTQTEFPLIVALAPALVPAAQATPAVTTHVPPVLRTDLYSPPDLYLLNSVFTI